jgi:hypothetical protein
MIAISIAEVQKVIAYFEDEIEAQVNQRLINLQKLLDTQGDNLNNAQKSYLTHLIADLPALVVATPSELKDRTESSEYKSLPKKKTFRKVDSKGNFEERSFKQQLEYYIDYSGFRSEFLPQYFSKIGIKACVYCNSQLAISTKVTEGLPRARFQVDHYLPKAKFPCFGLSLFNFYPSCASCNLIKSDNDVEFTLYFDNSFGLPKSAFSFGIKDGMLSQYILTQNVDDLEIKFIEKDPSQCLQETFDIAGIYATQKDIAEELIWKRQIYTIKYKEFLRSQFNVLYSDPTLSNRLIVGNYIYEKEIHKRPMAKFMQDIARQIGLIEEDE